MSSHVPFPHHPALAIARFFGAVSDWNDARVTREQLAKLSAHELRDIGLERGDIEGIERR